MSKVRILEKSSGEEMSEFEGRIAQLIDEGYEVKGLGGEYGWPIVILVG